MNTWCNFFRPVFQPACRLFVGMLMAVCVIAPPASGGVDSGGTGGRVMSYSRGTIYGFGSIVVNGIRYDDSEASIVDDDGAVRSRSDLKLGMTADVEGGPVATDPSTGALSAAANVVRFGSAIRGPVQAVDAKASTMAVLGQTVQITHSTVFDGLASGLADVRAGQLVEVHAQVDGRTGRYLATRVEAKRQVADYKLRGIVHRLDTAARSFSIGTINISYAGLAASETPALANGEVAMVHLQTSPAKGVWKAQRAAPGVPAIPDAADADIDGIVSDYAGLASFKLNGTPVDASGWWVLYQGGTNGQLRNGVRAVITGVVWHGVLVASRVEFKPVGEGDEISLHGKVESVNASAATFVLRGSTVAVDAKTTFKHGTAAGIKVGANVEVKGELAAGGTQVHAAKIKFGS